MQAHKKRTDLAPQEDSTAVSADLLRLISPKSGNKSSSSFASLQYGWLSLRRFSENSKRPNGVGKL
jgi:hypothetical protein